MNKLIFLLFIPGIISCNTFNPKDIIIEKNEYCIIRSIPGQNPGENSREKRLENPDIPADTGS